MKTIAHRYLGGLDVPQDIRDLRQSSFDFHEELGYPVIFKHRWTLKDFREGLVERCPNHDELYHSDSSWDDICFGTGFVGGFKDAEIVYISLSDAPVDTIKITDQGLLTLDQHPQMTAPWIPYMQDGDMIISTTFDPITWEILDIGDRYVLKTVNQVTLRGPGYPRRGRGPIGKPLTVHQEAVVDKLPLNHPLYEVPLIYTVEENPDITPPGEDPLDPGTSGTYTEHSIGLRIRGAEIHLQSSTERTLKIAVGGNTVSVERGFFITGEAEGVEFHW